MIQRIQSIWLLLSSIAATLIFFIPVMNFQPGKEIQILSADGNNLSFMMIPIWPFLLIAIFIPLISVFQFRNRLLQIRLGVYAILVHVIVFLMLGAIHLAELPQSIMSFDLGIVLIPLAMVFLFLAIRAIRKDEKLVRSVDRIR